MKDEGVEHIFGYPGGAVCIFDALQKQDDVQHILVRHEQGASHAADGYARATGKPGVVLVTSGPGATNAVTGIATAYMDSIPLVVITGQVPSRDRQRRLPGSRRGRHHPPLRQAQFPGQGRDKLARDPQESVSYVATTGRPGPVVVDIPKDITAPHVKIPYELSGEIKMRSYNPNAQRATRADQSARLTCCCSAERPMIYTGGGVILDDASEQLRKFVRKLGYPITKTLMGLGAYPGTDKQFVGMLGMHGTYEANMAMHNCDVLIAIGARFDDRVVGDVQQVLPLREDHSHRHRPGFDFEDGQGRYSDRR